MSTRRPELYARTVGEPRLRAEVRGRRRVLQRLGLGDDWLRAVCFGNAAELFGIEPKAPTALA
jgi:hypothetical protein